ncbi:hypothetical protein PT974_03894 [Cladobotryum mycophilum]|uniref:Uncharacterized protein n=1 Tax=Cladobotryum mycophilum TaxID=491253 RepID=A0ABR0STL6_9HYPO
MPKEQKHATSLSDSLAHFLDATSRKGEGTASNDSRSPGTSRDAIYVDGGPSHSGLEAPSLALKHKQLFKKTATKWPE